MKLKLRREAIELPAMGTPVRLVGLLYGREVTVYGWLAAGPMDFPQFWGGAVGIIAEWSPWPRPDSVIYVSGDDSVIPTVGCACGNPFTTCHPEA